MVRALVDLVDFADVIMRSVCAEFKAKEHFARRLRLGVSTNTTPTHALDVTCTANRSSTGCDAFSLP